MKISYVPKIEQMSFMKKILVPKIVQVGKILTCYVPTKEQVDYKN